jgi:hypothetical protein
MSQQKRVEPAISCEACHGPASNHVLDPEKNKIFKASNADPKRATEVCLQCHMRNRDKRLDEVNASTLFGDVRDYPAGYEPGKPLTQYKKVAPFENNDSDEFYGNGSGKKNRTQGNEYVKSMMYKHGITCSNCHSPHKLDNTSTKTLGDASCMKCHTLGSPIGPHQKTIEAHTHHKVGSKGSSCIECHMPKTGKHTKESPLSVRTHIFGFVSPADTKKYKVPNPHISKAYQQSSIGEKLFRAFTGILFSNELFAGHFSMYGVIHYNVPIHFGISFKNLLYSFIPSVIRKERPQDVYGYYAEQLNLPKDQGFTINHITAWYINFGLFGILIGSMFIGLMLMSPMLIGHVVWKHLPQNSHLFIMCMITCFGAMLVRSGPEGLKSILYEAIIIPMGLIWSYPLIQNLWNKIKS